MNSLCILSNEAQFWLPSEAKTRSGVVFYPQHNAWRYRDTLMRINLDFTELPATPALTHSTKQVLLWYAENMSPSHLHNMFSYFLMFLRYSVQATGLQLQEITAEHILNYRSFLQEDEYRLGSIKSFFLRWQRMQLPGIKSEATALLKKLKLKGNRKGEAVLTMHPTKGPLTEIEWQALHRSLETSYEAGKTRLEDYLLAWLIIALGQRPIQYSALKVSDFIETTGEDGQPKYFLRIPKAKQRGEIIRGSFHEHSLVTEIGAKLSSYVKKTKERFSSVIPDPRDAPLFPEYPLRLSEDANFLYHYVAQDLSTRFQEIAEALNVYSERTGCPLHITPKRLRMTYATRMAVEGYNERIIAANLGHADTQNVKVYTAASPEIAERIGKALDLRLSPLVKALSGEVITDESQALRNGDPSSRVCDLRLGAKTPVGSCGSLGGCERFAPLACYFCRQFQPWLDGPHQALMQLLLDERDRLASERDNRIASIHDYTIYAIKAVVDKCTQMRHASGSV